MSIEIGANGVFSGLKFGSWGGPPKLMHLYMKFAKKIKKMKKVHFWWVAPPKTDAYRKKWKIVILRPKNSDFL